MSRFWIDLPPQNLVAKARSLFSTVAPLTLQIGATVELGPKKVTAHMIKQSKQEQQLHKQLHTMLGNSGATFEYPQFTGENHKAHITQRKGISFEPGTSILASNVYLIEIIDHNRVVRSKIELGKS